MKPLQVKICGMRDEDNLRAILQLPIDYIGMIFYAQSKRFVSQINMDIFTRTNISKIGVFVNSTMTEILEKADAFQLDIIQLHGHETPELCKALKEQNKTVWKAFGIDKDFNFSQLGLYSEVVDCFLFDTKSDQHGGTGKVFDWSILKEYKQATPYLLSGGLGIENLHEALKIKDDRLIGVDLNSRLEIEPGVKNIHLVNQALQIIKQ